MRQYFCSRPAPTLVVATFLLFGFTSCIQPDSDANKPVERDGREVEFVTTPQVAVDRMLELCEPTKEDFVLDLGCGDGRIVITAAKKYGCRGIGYDIDPKLIELCNEVAERQGVSHLVEFRQHDIYKAKLPKDATIITMYLYPEMNLRLMPFLQSLESGKHVVSYRWEMPGVPSHRLEKINTGDRMMPLGEIHYFQTPMLVDPEWKPEPSSAVELDFDKIRDQLKFDTKADKPDDNKEAASKILEPQSKKSTNK